MYDFKAQNPEFNWSKYPTPKLSPYVVFIVTRNPRAEEPIKYREPWIFDLDHTAGTFEHVLRYQTKGYELIGYGNLLQENPAPGVTTAANAMADEHARIKAHIDQIIGMKTKMFAKAQAEAADDKTIQARVDAEVARVLAERLAEEQKKRDEDKKLDEAIKDELAADEKPAKKEALKK